MQGNIDARCSHGEARSNARPSVTNAWMHAVAAGVRTTSRWRGSRPGGGTGIEYAVPRSWFSRVASPIG